MAYRAFTAKFKSAIPSWFGSAFVGGQLPGASTRILICGPVVLASNSLIPVTSLAKSTGTGGSGWQRAKASSR
jgi:hypothetical protein